MAKRPLVLLADEPTGQLDTETSAAVMGLLRDAAAAGISVVLATHDAALADIADRTVVMVDGALSA